MTFFYNRFHQAGSGKSLGSSGFPHMKKLIDASPKVRNVWRVYLKGEHCADKAAAYTLAESIWPVYLKDVLRVAEVHYGIPAEDKEWVELWKDLHVDTLRGRLFDDTAEGYARFCIRFVVRRPWGRTAFEKLQAEFRDTFFFIHSPSRSTVLAFVPVDGVSLPTEPRAPSFLEKMCVEMPRNVLLSGLPGITQIQINRSPDTTRGLEFYLETDGGNLLHGFNAAMDEYMDYTRTYCMNPMYTQTLLGIECGARVLNDELGRVFEETGALDYHHVSLLVDFMTRTGDLMGVTRHTQNKIRPTGPLERATNEQGLKVISEAAASGRLDTVDGVSARVMTGQRVRVGTGMVDILVPLSVHTEE